MRKLSTAALAVALTMSTVNMTIPAHAKEGSVTALATNFAEAKDVALDKRWTITFNKAVSKNADLEKLVYVEDSEKNKVPVDISINTARTKVYVEPVGKYKAGETYELIINQALTSETGKKLKDTVVKKFTTVGMKQVFQESYQVKNTTNEEQQVTVSKGAYYQVINNEDPSYWGYSNDYEINEEQTVTLAPGETLYCDFKESGTVKSNTLNGNITKVSKAFFEIVNVSANEAVELFLKGNVPVLFKIDVGSNNQVMYGQKPNDGYDGDVENNYVDVSLGTDSIMLRNDTETIVENNGQGNISLLVPQQYAGYEKVSKSVDMKTYDLKPNEIVEIAPKDFSDLNIKSAPLHIVPKENKEAYGQFDYIHQYSSYSDELGFNYRNALGSTNNYIDEDMIFFFDKNIFNDSVYRIQNTGQTTLHLYGQYLTFKSSNTPLFSTYTVQPHEKVVVHTSMSGENDNFYVKHNDHKQSLNVFLATKEQIEYMGEMTLLQKDLHLPIYNQTILENTSDQPIEIYGSKDTISFEDVSEQEMPYEKIVVKPSESYILKNEKATDNHYFIGAATNEGGTYFEGEASYNVDTEEWGKSGYEVEIQASDDIEQIGYHDVYGFYQLAKKVYTVESYKQSYIENTGNENIIVYVPLKSMKYTQIK